MPVLCLQHVSEGPSLRPSPPSNLPGHLGVVKAWIHTGESQEWPLLAPGGMSLLKHAGFISKGVTNAELRVPSLHPTVTE